jgi:NADPH:quinone reductase-like Zn-dependent oxidoreductase
VLQHERVPTPVPGPGEVLVRIRAIAVNNWDVRWRSGHAPQVPGRPAPALPFQLGREGAGEIAAVGPGVFDRSVGERVVLLASPACGHCLYCDRGQGSLCVGVEIPGHTLWVPETVSPLCDLGVFVDQAAKPVPAPNAHTGHSGRQMRASGGRLLPQ